MKNINKFFASVVMAAILTPALALGATMHVGEEVFIEKGSDIRDNLYVAGGNVSVSGAVLGDLLTAGGNVLITENVSEDISVAGGAVTVLGDSGGDVRVFAGDVLIAGDIAGELVVTGGSVIVSSDVSIGKELIVAGGQVSVDGDVLGDAQIVGGVVTLNGNIKGDVKVKVGEKLTIGESAVIGGNLEYSAPSSDILKVAEGSVIAGETVFKEVDTAKMDGVKDVVFAATSTFMVMKLISLVLVALILVWLFRSFSNSVVGGVVQNPLRMLGYGFAALVLVPAASLALFVTLFGIPLGFMAVLSYIFLIVLSCVYVGVVTGAWVSKLVRKSDSTVITWKNVILGFALFTMLKFVPIIGWIIALLLFLVTLGSIVDIVHKKMWRSR